MHCCGNDTIYSANHYVYDPNGDLKYILSEHYENGIIVKTDKIKPPKTAPEPPPKTTERKNQKGQIIEQHVADLVFPCGIYYEGKHTIMYSYTEGGLMESGNVFDSKNKLILHFSYTYEYY